MAAVDRVGAGAWTVQAEVLLGRVAAHAPRRETGRRLGTMITALLGDVGRKNCWTLAEAAGESGPWGMRHLLGRAVWDTDAVAAELRAFVGEHLGAPDGVLIVDETGDAKKGSATVGVQRQYSGTLGRVENCQVAVHLAYASSRGHALVDRELYLPQSWTGDPERCARAGVPSEVAFATKPALAATMIGRAVDAGMDAAWVAGDEVYGADPKLAARVEELGLGYVLAIASSTQVAVDVVNRASAASIAAALPDSAFEERSAGAGAHGQRYHQWAWVALHPPAHADAAGAEHRGRSWSLLIRRTPRTGELAYYRCYSPGSTALSRLVAVAGRRWAIEESFQAAKSLAGLDEHQVRGWTPWRRWSLLAMCAHALLAVITATERAAGPPPRTLIAITCAEVRRLITAAAATAVDPEAVLAWSHWRRRAQHRARASHYAARGQRPPP